MSAAAVPATRRHPVTDIVVLACALVLVFGIPSPIVPLAVLIGSVVAAAVSPTVRASTWAASVAVFCLPMLIVVGIVQGLFHPGAEVEVLWKFGPARVSVEGLAIAVQLWLRVTALVALCVLVGLGADAARLFDGFVALRVPAALAYVCASAITLIPLVRRRTRDVLDARAARGWPTERWGLRIRLLPGIVTTVVTALLLSVDQRHEVLDQRGFFDSDHRVALQDHRDDRLQRLIRRGGPVLTAVLVVLSVLGRLPLPGAGAMVEGLR